MTELDGRTGLPAHAPLTLTHVIYGLHAWSALAGITGTAFIVTAFLAGWPSILAVILNYVKRSDAAGTFLESHFRWQIRTFWFALLWSAIGFLAFVTLIGIVVAIPIWIVTGLWVLYRIVRGWIALASGRALPV
ncbi:MAG: DUF4870 family protein [Burkholderiales bacterium]